jgi:hypothetical protein
VAELALGYPVHTSIVVVIVVQITYPMTSTLMNMNNTNNNNNTLPESMQRMITPQYEQIVNEIENIYHHPDTGCSSFFTLIRI